MSNNYTTNLYGDDLMKKFAAIFLVFALVFSLFGCSGKKVNVGTTTLMIYMVGSDLEAKAANATNDLEEMANSGVDLENANIIVYAGGSKKWHNDVVAEQEHTLLKLGSDGFEKVKSMPEASMGEAETLTSFLNYAYQNYPADNFELILWNHGNGPVIGYGKDMVFENDSLTLKEMQTALENSPFSAENRLKWVGFDACLMSSAELACIFDDYADYLVASQEVEPHFGWDYSFLSGLTSTGFPDILENITQTYYTTCEEYFAEKGYSGRETTLSVMDLSKAADVENAINTLFAKAEPDVPVNYNSLAAKRVDTRALGRASTGSEYDLIDIGDMAEKLEELYPQEAKALKKAIEDMVIVNQTNTEGLCGVSIYYPFYNKKRYEKEWSSTYEELNMFADYCSYLQAYSDIWLGNDFLGKAAASAMPSMSAQGVYNLELTPEQVETYADSKFIILERAGDDLYKPLFISSNVEKSGDTLTTNFDGNIIYSKNKFNEYFIPVSHELDTVGDVSHYSVSAAVASPDVLDMSMKYPDKNLKEYMNFHIAVDNSSKDISISALVPIDSETDTDTLIGGKIPEPDLSQYAKYLFLELGYYYVTRYDNGAVRPIGEWSRSSVISWFSEPIGDGLEFVFAPLVTGEYYFIYQIEDTQGNKYCSDIMPIRTTGSLPEPVTPETVEVNWQNGDSIDLGEYAGVDISMKVIQNEDGDRRYTVACHNNNDFSVDFVGYDIFVNDNIYCHDLVLGYFNIDDYHDSFIDPGETIILDENGFDFGEAEDAGKVTDIRSILFTFDIVRADNRTTLVYNQGIKVNITANHNISLGGDNWLAVGYDFPSRSLFATEHQLYNDGKIKISVVGLGDGNKEPSSYGFADTAEDVVQGDIGVMFCFENLGTEVEWVQVEALIFDGIAVPMHTDNIDLPPGYAAYDGARVLADELDRCGITSASKVEVLFRRAAVEAISGTGGFSQYYRVPVQLAQSGAPARFTDGNKVLLNENGVEISLVSFEMTQYTTQWILAVTNSSENDYSIAITDIVHNGKLLPNDNASDDLAIVESTVMSGGKTYVEVSWFGENNVSDLASKIAFMDLSEERIIAVSETQIDWYVNGQPLE